LGEGRPEDLEQPPRQVLEGGADWQDRGHREQPPELAPGSERAGAPPKEQAHHEHEGERQDTLEPHGQPIEDDQPICHDPGTNIEHQHHGPGARRRPDPLDPSDKIVDGFGHAQGREQVARVPVS
jgi:hypothetical protein